MKQIVSSSIAAFTIFLLASCGNQNKVTKTTENKGLKDHYQSYFNMGVAVSPRALKTDEGNLVTQHFNSVTAENAMKMGPIHPKENVFDWRGGDSIAAFAKRHNMKMRGHCLVWHNQTPDWLFKDAAGNKVSKEVLLQRMKDHITAVVTRYKDVIYAWDVVNEVISDKPNEMYRPSPFLDIIGEEFVAKSFEYAHAADPKAMLFYNDYNEISAVKRAKIIKMINGLKAKGVPIHGIGLQAHWAVNEPSESQLESTLKDFSELGLKMHITELDISVYPKEHNARERTTADYDTSFSAQKEAAQIAVYKMCFEKFRKYKQHISSVTFWNISERYSWLDNFPVKDRKDYPLLFDRNLQPKKAYYEIIKW